MSTVLKKDLEVVCNSLEKARSLAPDIGPRFYRLLISESMEMKAVFDSVSMKTQHTRFFSMLNIILIRMRDQRPFISLLQDLGKQHLKYRIRGEDFVIFQAVFLKLLHELFGSEFDESLRNSWVLVFEKINQIMRSGIDYSTAKISRAN